MGIRPGVAILCVVLAAAGCADTPPSSPPTPGDIDTAAYPPCAEQPPPPAVPHVPGLTLPAGAAIFSVDEVGPLTQASGIVAMTPLEARAYYEGRDDLDVLSVEDERVEAEILVSDGTHRMFIKVQIACATASNFTATVGAEADSPALPSPAGTARP